MLAKAVPLALAVLLGFQGGRLFLAAATPRAPAGDPPATVRPILPVALAGDFDPFFRLATATGSAVVTALPIKLYGTRLDEATGRGFAIISTPDGVQSSFAVGEQIMPGVKLWSVARDEVTIDRNGARERLFLDQSVPPGSTGGLSPSALPVAQPSLQQTNDPGIQRIDVPPAPAGKPVAGEGDVVAPSIDQAVPAMPAPTSDRGGVE